ncbi:serine/threonine-protein kinase pim-1-like isoform X1 [Oculina patagonica]
MNAELSRKRKHSVTRKDAQSSRGPQKGDSLNVRAPPKVRKLGVDSKPYKIEKFTTEKVPKSRKRAHSDSDLNSDHAVTRRKKRCLSTPEPIKKTELKKEEKEKTVPEQNVPTASTSNGPVRRKKTRRGKRGGKNRHKGLSAYEMGKPLGSGGFGDVYAARRKRDNLPVAIKFVNKSKVKNYREINGRQFPAEAFYQRHIHHPNVIELLDIFSHEDNFVFVLERPENSSDLFDYIDRRDFLAEDEGRQLFTNILDAAIQCEQQGVTHRDIKPENIIVDLYKMEAKLTDFGLACDTQEAPFRRFVGTQHYCPPEFYSHRCFLGTQATVWQLGFLLTEMITGEMPYVKPRMALYMRPSIPKRTSKDARSLISWMLSRDPDARPTLEQVRRHAWINKPHHY